MRYIFNRHRHLTDLLFIFYSLSYLLVQEHSALSKIARGTIPFRWKVAGGGLILKLERVWVPTSLGNIKVIDLVKVATTRKNQLYVMERYFWCKGTSAFFIHAP